MTAKENVLAASPKACRHERVSNSGVVTHIIRDDMYGGNELGTGATPKEAWNKAARRLVTDTPL